MIANYVLGYLVGRGIIGALIGAIVGFSIVKGGFILELFQVSLRKTYHKIPHWLNTTRELPQRILPDCYLLKA